MQKSKCKLRRLCTTNVYHKLSREDPVNHNDCNETEKVLTSQSLCALRKHREEV